MSKTRLIPAANWVDDTLEVYVFTNDADQVDFQIMKVDGKNVPYEPMRIQQLSENEDGWSRLLLTSLRDGRGIAEGYRKNGEGCWFRQFGIQRESEDRLVAAAQVAATLV